MPTATPCETCDSVHMDTRKLGPSRWVCVRFPRVEGLSPIAPTKWVELEPYMRCVGINGGHCALWTARREGQKDNGL